MHIRRDAKPRTQPPLPVKLKRHTQVHLQKLKKTSETQETFQEPDDNDPNPADDTLSSASSDSLYNPFG